jgi:hypothetical protein
MNGNNGNIVEAFQCANCGGSSSSSSSVKEVEDLTLNLNLHAARIKDLEAQVMILSDKATSAGCFSISYLFCFMKTFSMYG